MIRTMGVVTTTDPATRVHPLSRAEYDQMVERGFLEGERVELIEGVLVRMPPMSDRHASAIILLNRWFSTGLPDRFVVRPQVPFAASDYSKPEPDIAIADFVPRAGEHPSHLHLAIEVTLSTHHTDLVVKPHLYAAAGVPRYWVLDLAAGRLVEHTDPQGEEYRTIVAHGPDAVLTFEGIDVDVARLL